VLPASRYVVFSWVPHWPGGLLCLNGAAARFPLPFYRLFGVPNPNPWGDFLVFLCVSEFQHFLSIVHAVAFRIVCEKLTPGVGLPAFLCATPWVSMAALRPLFAMLVSNQSCGHAARVCTCALFSAPFSFPLSA
jgi:hypothetical protein